MNNKERIEDLKAYKQLLEGRVASPTPEKHKGHPKTYRAYLERELKMVTDKIERIKHE